MGQWNNGMGWDVGMECDWMGRDGMLGWNVIIWDGMGCWNQLGWIRCLFPRLQAFNPEGTYWRN